MINKIHLYLQITGFDLKGTDIRFYLKGTMEGRITLNSPLNFWSYMILVLSFV